MTSAATYGDAEMPLYLFFCYKINVVLITKIKYLAQARREIPQKLDQIFHGFDDFGNSQIVQHLFALADDFPHFALVEA